MTELTNLVIANNEYWRAFKVAKTRELTNAYKIKRITLVSYSQPMSLAKFKSNIPCENKYATALKTGGDILLRVWKDLIEELALKNGNPAKIRAEYLYQSHSAQRNIYARITVTRLGWWNCVNNSIRYADGKLNGANFKSYSNRYEQRAAILLIN